MNKNELLNVLKEFIVSKDNVILIDGKWGSGKTYLLNEFIKDYKETPIYYVSLLGKRNIDDINTSLYMEVHKDEVIHSIVPTSVSPFNDVSSLDYILKINNKCKYLVILDDLERYGSTHYDEFLSYVSSLVLKGVKVIVVSNLSYLGSGEKYNFEMYKEKIFDHVYKADLFSSSLLERKLNKYYKYFDESLISLFNNNIRIVDKCEEFLEIIDNHLKDKFPRDNESVIKSIIFYTLIFLTTFYNEIPLSYPKLQIKGKEEERKYIFSKCENEEDGWEIFKVYEFSLNIVSSYKLDNPLDLIIVLYFLYIYGKEDYLLSIFLKI